MRNNYSIHTTICIDPAVNAFYRGRILNEVKVMPFTNRKFEII